MPCDRHGRPQPRDEDWLLCALATIRRWAGAQGADSPEQLAALLAMAQYNRADHYTQMADMLTAMLGARK